MTKKQKTEYIANVNKLEAQLHEEIESLLRDHPYAKSIIFQHLHERESILKSEYNRFDLPEASDSYKNITYCAKYLVCKTFYSIIPSVKEKPTEDLVNGIIENWNNTKFGDEQKDAELTTYVRGYVKYTLSKFGKDNDIGLEENDIDIDDSLKNELMAILENNA